MIKPDDEYTLMLFLVSRFHKMIQLNLLELQCSQYSIL